MQPHGRAVITHRLAHEDVVGTRQGYAWHQRDRSEACEPCTTAHAEAMQEWRDRRNPDPDRRVKVPLVLLGELLAAVPDDARSGFVERLGHIAVRAAAASAQVARQGSDFGI
jgi:hypothetical protein